MMQLAAYGRLGVTPTQRDTSTGNVMATATMAVDMATARDEGAPPLWLGLVAFGRQAEELLRHKKGDLISVAGRAQRSRWTDRSTGEQREQLQVVADSVLSARTVRPGGRRRTKTTEVEYG